MLFYNSLSLHVHVGLNLCSSPSLRYVHDEKQKDEPAVVAVDSQSLSGVTDVLLQRQRTSTRSSTSSSTPSSTLRAPTTILKLRRVQPGLSQIHLVKLHDTCWNILRREKLVRAVLHKTRRDQFSIWFCVFNEAESLNNKQVMEPPSRKGHVVIKVKNRLNVKGLFPPAPGNVIKIWFLWDMCTHCWHFGLRVAQEGRSKWVQSERVHPPRRTSAR